MKIVSAIFLLAVLSVGPQLAATVPSGLSAPEAPFKAKAASPVPSVRDKPFFDAKNRTFVFGSKRFIFKENAAYTYMSGSKSIMTSYFFVNTPFDGWQPNSSCKVVKEYTGGTLCITSVIADADRGTLTFKGVVPFHLKSDKTPVLREWTHTVSLAPDGKLDFQFHFETPDGKKFKDSGIFFHCPGVRSDKRTYAPQNIKDWYNFCDDELVTDDPMDSVKLILKSKSYIHPFQNQQFRYSPMTLEWHYAIDPGSYGAARELPPGGVDFKAGDNLIIPERGSRNLLLNPYFAQGSNYFWVCGENLVKGHCEECIPVAEKGALFGKYCMPALGGFYLNAVPAEPGDYVLSFYAKGKGSAYLQVSDEVTWYQSHKRGTIQFTGKPGEWKRYEFPFQFNKRGVISIIFNGKSEAGNVAYLDGFQLEAGTKATAFEAPLVSAGLVSPDGLNFFEAGKPMKCELELSTLSEKVVRGKAEVAVSNFFKEIVMTQDFTFSLKDKEYPRFALPVENLPQGIYVVHVKFSVEGAKQSANEFFRFAVMPFLKNEHRTARIFSMTYLGGHASIQKASERLLARYRKVGVGCFGHASAMSNDALELYKKYKVIPFDGGCTGRLSSAAYKKRFPDLDVPPGRTFFYVMDPTRYHWNDDCAVFPDYRLVGGWTPEYRAKFIDACISQLKKMPGMMAYRIGSEWPLEIKEDPHYIDLVEAFAEAVRKVYPKAIVYEAGDCNMDITRGVAQLDSILPRYRGRGFKPELLACHTYTKDIAQLYPNLKAFVAVAEKHGYGNTMIAFPEGMHFYPHSIPEWGREMVCWNTDGYGAGPLSYDLGWYEMLSTAYYMRCYLVYFTIFDRLWCGTSSANYINSFVMDTALTPRGIQKVPNTLGTLLGNPRKYVGDFTFAPETKCLVWIDGNGCPLAAVWNENQETDHGKKDSPFAVMDYKGAAYIDMMGVERKSEADGRFPVSPFPLFIRGRKGEIQAFTQALSKAVIRGSALFPFRIVDSFESADRLKFTLVNDLARPIGGTFSILGKTHKIELKALSSQELRISLPEELRISTGKISKLSLPLQVNADGQSFRSVFETSAFAAGKFTGDWTRIPPIEITNRVLNKKSPENSGQGDFAAKFQLAWDARKLYLRVTVKDDVFTAGTLPVNRWMFDACQVYLDTRCSARLFGRKSYDEDDYDYTLMPTADGKKLEVWRALSPDIQLTLGIAAPKNNSVASEIPAKFTRTEDGYIYEAEFPADYILPARLTKGYNMGFALYVVDRDRSEVWKQALSLSTQPGSGCYDKPHTWPLVILVE